MLVEWIPEENTVKWQNTEIVLLAKEYALLHFMYKHAGMVLSREQLLDGVWPMEYPTERTVDDHIYRLRKKLRPLPAMQLRTIRGFGYSLILQKDSAPGISPTLADDHFQGLMQEAMAKYHRYGQGASMLTLAQQQEKLGFRLNAFYAVFVRYVQGDWNWLVNTEEVSLHDRLYLMLVVYGIIGDHERALGYCQSALAAGVLPPMQHMEMEILNILDLFVITGRVNEALNRLQLTWQTLADPKLEPFVAASKISELFVLLAAGRPFPILDKKVECIELLLQQKPYLREIGSFQVMKGLLNVQTGKWEKGEALLDEGLEVLEASGFVPLRLMSLGRLTWFLEQLPSSKADPVFRLQRKYAALMEEQKERFGLDGLALLMDKQLATCLR